VTGSAFIGSSGQVEEVDTEERNRESAEQGNGISSMGCLETLK
jgi:hypothetical protein